MIPQYMLLLIFICFTSVCKTETWHTEILQANTNKHEITLKSARFRCHAYCSSVKASMYAVRACNLHVRWRADNWLFFLKWIQAEWTTEQIRIHGLLLVSGRCLAMGRGKRTVATKWPHRSHTIATGTKTLCVVSVVASGCDFLKNIRFEKQAHQNVEPNENQEETGKR